MKLLVLSAAIVGLLAVTASSEKVSYRNYKIHTVVSKNEADSKFLYDLSQKMELDFWSALKRNGGETNVMVSPNLESTFLAAIDKQGLEHSLKHSDVQKLIDAAPMVTRRADDEDHGMDWDNFHDLDTIYAWFDYLDAKYENVALETIGQSYEGTDMKVIKFCNGECGNRPAMYLQGGIHAREWITPAVVTYMINELAENAAAHQDLLDNLDWYILPVTNPDGYAYTISDDRFWRKTRSPNADSECVGTDPNRNWDFEWGGLGTSDSPCSNVYHGEFPNSEIETANVVDFTMAHKDQIKFFDDVHAAASMALYPWGYTDELSPDHERLDALFNRAADALTEVNGYVYEVGTVYEVIYPASGITVDWAYGGAGIPYSTTIELRADDGFTPPPTNIKLEGAEVWAFHKSIAYDIIEEYA